MVKNTKASGKRVKKTEKALSIHQTVVNMKCTTTMMKSMVWAFIIQLTVKYMKANGKMTKMCKSYLAS